MVAFTPELWFNQVHETHNQDRSHRHAGRLSQERSEGDWLHRAGRSQVA